MNQSVAIQRTADFLIGSFIETEDAPRYAHIAIGVAMLPIIVYLGFLCGYATFRWCYSIEWEVFRKELLVVDLDIENRYVTFTGIKAMKTPDDIAEALNRGLNLEPKRVSLLDNETYEGVAKTIQVLSLFGPRAFVTTELDQYLPFPIYAMPGCSVYNVGMQPGDEEYFNSSEYGKDSSAVNSAQHSVVGTIETIRPGTKVVSTHRLGRQLWIDVGFVVSSTNTTETIIQYAGCQCPRPNTSIEAFDDFIARS